MYADKILINGKIYTENKDMMWAEAVAVKGSRFICVGKNEECMKYRGDSTQVVELDGQNSYSRPYRRSYASCYGC